MKKGREIFQFERIDRIIRTIDITVHAHNLKEAEELVKLELNWENCVESETVEVGKLKLTYGEKK